MNDPSEISEGWLLNDMKAPGLIAHGIASVHHKQNSVGYLGSSCGENAQGLLQSGDAAHRVSMTHPLYDFKMEDGMTMMSKQLDDFKELVVGLQTLNEPLDEARQLVTADQSSGGV